MCFNNNRRFWDISHAKASCGQRNFWTATQYDDPALRFLGRGLFVRESAPKLLEALGFSPEVEGNLRDAFLAQRATGQSQFDLETSLSMKDRQPS